MHDTQKATKVKFNRDESTSKTLNIPTIYSSLEKALPFGVVACTFPDNLSRNSCIVLSHTLLCFVTYFQGKKPQFRKKVKSSLKLRSLDIDSFF